MSEEFDQKGARARGAGRVEPARSPRRSISGEVLDRLAEIARARIGVDIVRIWLLDDARRVPSSCARRRASPARHCRPEAAAVAARVRSRAGSSPTASPLCIADVPADARLVNRAWFAAEGVVSLLARADHARRPADRDPRVSVAHPARVHAADVALAQALTAPAVAAVRNAALYAEALARLEEIQAFQRVASETLSVSRARDRAPRGGPRAARAAPLRCRPVHLRGPARRAGCAR